jgi:hypothetical protein
MNPHKLHHRVTCQSVGTSYFAKFEHVQVTCRIVDKDGLSTFLCGGLLMPNCQSSGSMIPPFNNRSLQSSTSDDIFPKAHSDCSLTASSRLFAIKSINRGMAPFSTKVLACGSSPHAMFVMAHAASSCSFGESYLVRN